VVKFKRYAHQFSLFNFEDMRPRIRFSVEDKLYLRIRCNDGKHAMKNGDTWKTLEALTDIRERLESFERRITQKPRK
jgi:hypothetical protein